MAPGTGEVEPIEREPVARVAEQRAPQEELVEAVLAVHRVATGQAVVALEVERGEDLPRDDQPGEPRRDGRASRTTRSPSASRCRPRSPSRSVYGVALDDDAHDVAASPAGCAPSTSDGSASDGIVASIIGCSREPAVLGRVVGPFHGVDPGRDHDPAAEQPRVVAGRR